MFPIRFSTATLFALGAMLPVACAAKAPAKPKTAKSKPSKPMSITDFKLPALDGKTIDFAQFKGHPILIVNTASKCGYTPQYTALQQLQEKYAKAGLVVLGFPANNFGGQEPGTDAQIGEFCQKNYGVTFQMFSKVSVKGADQAPLFRYLTQEANPALKGDIGWNFEKFLIGRDGQLVARFKSNVKPDAPELTSAVEQQLAAK